MATLARKVLGTPTIPEGTRLRMARHLACGTEIEVVRQRTADSRVVVRLVGDQKGRSYLVPADAIDAASAMSSSIHRPPRHRRASGGSYLPLDWKSRDV